MKKVFLSALCTFMLFSVLVCASEASFAKSEVLTGSGKGFGGLVTVTVTKVGDKIITIDAVGANETKGIGSRAIELLPQAIVDANSTNVDLVSGATVTSKAIVYAVNNALDPVNYPAPTVEAKKEVAPVSATAAKLFMGFGLANNGRIGPGKDDTGTQVYSVNQLLASVLFDEDGRILSLYFDEIEIATPNYDGEGMPHFSGFPGQGGYNNDANHDEKIDSKTIDTQDNFVAEIESWVTKRDRGDHYMLNSGTWTDQVITYQNLFIGKTVAEVEDWYNRYTSDLNGRPLKANSSKDEDKAKYEALSTGEKAMLADVTSSATMSLNDAHGNFIQAIKTAYEKRVPVDIKSAASQGFGLVNAPRIGPGKDDLSTQVYSINQVFANTLFDANGRILFLYIDQLEVATPNYDGEGMPHFSGFPGQGGYNYDANHDEKIDSKTIDTQDSFLAEVESWVTKRDRGSHYVLNSGTWTEQITVYQNLFIGKTVQEVEEWFNKYTSDINGRPLQANSSKEQDQAKYNTLSSSEKAMLADVVSGATMSLNDSHGNIIQAIINSFKNRVKIDLTVK